MFLKDIIITAVICVALAGILTAIVVSMINNKRKGKSTCSCGCSCGGCAMNGVCHKGSEDAQTKIKR